jgi:hypothetical protein
VSPLPGVTYESRDSSGVSGPPLDTATAFIGGLAEKGPVDRPVFRSTLAQFKATYGEEVPYGYLHDAAAILPEEEAAGAWFQRVVGEDAVAASAQLTDGDDPTLEVTAVDPGDWADGIEVKTTVGGGNVVYTITFRDEDPEVSPALATNADAVAWAENSAYVRFKDLGGGDPTGQTVELDDGDDDRASVTDADRAAALPLFTADLGPGQVLWPGATTTAMYTALLKHAESHNRTALLDGADTHTVATLAAAAATLRALGDPAGCGGLFAPWAIVPGPAAGIEKTIPYSIIQAGLCARRDRDTLDPTIGVANPNEPAAGTHDNAGVSIVAAGLSQEAWTDVDRETLNNAGVNVARIVYKRVVTYGYRTLANPVTHKLDQLLNNRRIDMAIIAASLAIGEDFNLRQVDGRGKMLADYGAAIVGRVMMPYLEVGALFGTREEAFSVDTGDQVNPKEQLAEGLVIAAIGAKRSPFAEQIKNLYMKKEL